MIRRAAGLISLVVLGACRPTPAPETSSSTGRAAERSVVVYSSPDKEFAELIFRAYEEKTGVEVLPLYDTEETKTAGLTARLVAEKARAKADTVGRGRALERDAGVGEPTTCRGQYTRSSPLLRCRKRVLSRVSSGGADR